MTRQDHIALAAGLQKAKPPDATVTMLLQWNRDCVAIADVCQADDPQFNRTEFLWACNGGEL